VAQPATQMRIAAFAGRPWRMQGKTTFLKRSNAEEASPRDEQIPPQSHQFIQNHAAAWHTRRGCRYCAKQGAAGCDA
jgi:hypothetical protein